MNLTSQRIVKRLSLFLFFWLSVFVVVNGASYFFLSDLHGIHVDLDGIVRIGWPHAIFEQGGIYYARIFHLQGFLLDLGAAAFVAAALALGWRVRSSDPSELAN
jgi:hypothetical protein